MSAQPRDLLKPRAQRLQEVYTAAQEQVGLADGQMVAFGCVLAPGATPQQLAISAGEFVSAGSVLNLPAVTGQVLTALTNLAAGQSCYVLVEADMTQPTPVLTLTQSAIVAAGLPVMPSPTATKIVLGYLSLAGVFTMGTTALTGPMCITQAYSAGNVNPSGVQGPTGSTGGF